MKLDCLAEEIQFVDHLIPIWKALPAESRGRFMTHFAFMDYARRRGVEPSPRILDSTNPVLVASFGDMKTAQAMGRTRIARIEHGIGQSYGGDPSHPIANHGSYAGGEGAGGVALFLVPNEHAAARWRAAYPAARVEIVGCPKLDELPVFAPPPGPPIIGVSVHWDWHYLPELLSAFIPYNHAFIDLARSHRVLGHAHPKAAPQVSRWFAKKSIPYAEHFAEIVETASVFVCDNSSALYEFAATGRPVVVLNLPEYRRWVLHGLRFWSAANVGVQCDRPDALAASVDLALTDPPDFKAAREAALYVVYAYRSGASLRAATTLVDWLETAPAPVVRLDGRMTPHERVEAYRAAV